MSLVWQIIRKDLLRFRFILLGWVLLLAGEHLFFAAISGVFGHPSLPWLKWFEFPWPLFFAGPGVPLAIAYLLVAALVFEDPPAGRDPFWVTRPISGVQLLAAKFLVAVLMFVLVPLLTALPWWLACGFGAAEIAPLAGYTGGAYLLVVLLGLAMASLTNGYPRYVVWTLGGLAVVMGAHVAPLVFRRFLFGGIRGDQAPEFAIAMLAICVAVLSLEIAGQRFVVRHFRKSLPVVAVLTLIASVGLFAAPPATLARLFTPDAGALPAEENIRVTVASDVRTFDKGGLSLPLRVEGLPANAVPTLWMNATWRSPDGKIWPVRGHSGGSLRGMRRVAKQLLRHTQDDSPRTAVDSVNFILAPQYAERIATEASTVEGKVRIYSSLARLAAEAPVAPGTRRFSGGSFTVSDYLRAPGDVSFLLTVRAPRGHEGWRGFGYVALVHRRTGAIIEPAMLDQQAGANPIFTDLTVISVRMRFKLPDPQWLDEASLVLIGLDKGHDLNAVVPAYVRPADRAASLLPPWLPFSAEVLREYTGTYQPRPGALLTIKERRGTLELLDRGFFRMALLPVSKDHFTAPNQDWIFVSDGGFQVEFVRNAAGRVTHFLVHQDGRDFIVPRMPDQK